MGYLSRLLSSLLICFLANPTHANYEPVIYYHTDAQIALFMKGYHSPYKPEYVRKVVGKVRIGKNGALINLPDPAVAYPKLNLDFDFEEDNWNYQTNFIIVHALDLYSTYKGLKYDCISEANPLVGKHPSLGELIFFKVGIITLLEGIYGDYPTEWEAFQTVSAMTTGIVVQNNFDVISDARDNPRCNKK